MDVQNQIQNFIEKELLNNDLWRYGSKDVSWVKNYDTDKLTTELKELEKSRRILDKKIQGLNWDIKIEDK